MASFGAVWVQLNDRENDLERLQQQGYVSDIIAKPDDDFVCVHTDTDPNEYPEDILAEISQAFGDAVFIGIETNADFFIYGHWQGGELVRELTYSGDDGWLQVTGEAEPWEHEILFSSGNLEAAIAATGEENATDVQQFWDRQALQEGSQLPKITADDLYYRLLSYFKMPGIH
jgi:hypothetical protein